MSKEIKNQSENVNLLNAETAAVPAPAEVLATENTSTEEATSIPRQGTDTHHAKLDLSYRGMQRVMTTANTNVTKRIVNLNTICAEWYTEYQNNEEFRSYAEKIGVSKKTDFKPVILFGRFYVDGCVCRILRGASVEKYKDDPRKVTIFAGGEPRSALKVTESGDRLLKAAKNALFCLIRDGFADDIKADKAAREAVRKAKKHNKKNNK